MAPSGMKESQPDDAEAPPRAKESQPDDAVRGRDRRPNHPTCCPHSCGAAADPRADRGPDGGRSAPLPGCEVEPAGLAGASVDSGKTPNGPQDSPEGHQAVWVDHAFPLEYRGPSVKVEVEEDVDPRSHRSYMIAGYGQAGRLIPAGPSSRHLCDYLHPLITSPGSPSYICKVVPYDMVFSGLSSIN